MGDILLSSVVFRALREKYKDAELHYMISEKYVQVIENHPYIDRVVFFEDRFLENIKKIRKEKYQIVIDQYSIFPTAIMAFLSGAQKRIGYFRNYTSFLYSDTVERRKPTEVSEKNSAIEDRLKLLQPLGISATVRKPEIFITNQEKEEAKTFLEKLGMDFDKKTVMISTFGSSPEKTYPYMKEVLEIVSQNADVQILCNYLPSQKQDFLLLYDGLSPETQKKIIKNFDTQNLRQYISVLSFCQALIGNEGGSTNISKALGIPTFSIFAPFVFGWNWWEDHADFVSVQVGDYLSENKNYEDFKPTLFENKLIHFIKNHLS